MSALILSAALSQLISCTTPKQLEIAAIQAKSTYAPQNVIGLQKQNLGPRASIESAQADFDCVAANSIRQAQNVSIQPSNLLQQGVKLYQTEQFAEAVKVLQQANQAFQNQGDKLNQALTLNYISLAAQKLGKWSEANKAIANSLALLQTSATKDNSQEYLSILAQAYNTQGQLQLAQGQSEKALTSWNMATTAYTKIGDTAGIIGSQINQAQALQALGLYRRALITLTQVNQTLQQQPDSQLKVDGLLSLGNTLRLVGELDQKDSNATEISSLGSRQVLEQSLAVAERLQSPEAVAQAYLSLGNTASSQQKTAEALKFYQQATALSTSPITQIEAQLNQLHLLVETRQFLAAQALLPQIQPQLATLPPSRKSVYAYINFAQSLMKQGSQPRAGVSPVERTGVSGGKLRTINSSYIAQILATAVQQSKSLGDSRAQAYALGTLGGLYLENKQWADAQKLTEQALLLAETIAAPDIAYRWQWQLGRILTGPSNPQGNLQGAIAAYTKAVNILKSLRSDLIATNPEVQFSFREGVEPVYRELVSLLLQSGNNQPSQQNLSQARDVIESLQLAELENFFRKACLEAQPVQIDSFDRTAAVIYPVILSDRLEVIVSLPNQPLRHYVTSLPQNQVETTVDQLRQKLVNRVSNQFLPLSQEVYNWLIRPVESELKNSKVKTLVFVLDGSLRNVPMATLHDGEQYLVEKYNIALTPGLQLLNPQPLLRKRLQVLVAGLSQARQNFNSLPGVEIEVQQIKSQVPAQVLLNQEFTTAAIKNEVNSFPAPVIHLATHGQFSSNAADTFILTWDDRVNVNALRTLLQAREINKRGAIELLVLSACKTAAGDKRAALGLAGVAVRSGARSTLASLWLVNDEATTELMGEFYKEFTNTTVTKAEALRRAQITLLKNPNYQHPYFWAPFVMVGNWL